MGATAETRSPLWPFRFGAPFLLQNATPTLLEGVNAHPSDQKLVPGEGRQLLSFTDSRQGTARFAANIETQSERGYVRAFIYHLTQKALAKGSDPEKRASIEMRIAKFAPLAADDPDFAHMLNQAREELAALDKVPAVAWSDAVQGLADDPTVKQWIRKVWSGRDERYRDSPEVFSEFLMLRELARRPRRANAVETMGLARLSFASIEALSERALPSQFREKGLSLQDWRDFLYFLIDVSIRNLFVVRMDRRDAQWLLPRQAFLKNIVGPNDLPANASDRSWPAARAGSAKSNAVKLLERTLKLDAADPADRAVLNEVLERAWRDVRPVLESNASTYALDFSRASLEPVLDAWLCPVTNRVLPRPALGISPYALRSTLPAAQRKPEPIRMPILPIAFPRNAEDRSVIADFLMEDPVTAGLRDRGVWSNLHTRAATFAPYIRAEEHSAQQPPSRLRGFEEEFKRHEINLLACSTTMEMGVDIGAVEAVLNTNVPPSIANYRQRVGRAGRRGQSFSTSLTFARDTPLDREAFLKPIDYAPQLFADIPRLLAAVAQRLDCSARCERGCSSCVLASDLFAQQEIVDRKAALEFVTQLLGELAAPKDDDKVAADAALSGPVADAIVRKLKSDQIITLLMSEDLDVSALYQPPLSSLFEKAHRLGAKIRLALPQAAFSAMDDATRRGLRNASHRFCFVPVILDMQPAANGAWLVASTEDREGALGYYSRDPLSRVAGDRWGVGSEHPIVTVRMQPPSGVPIGEEDLERTETTGDRVRELKAALSRPAHQFGEGLVKNLLKPELEAADLWKAGRLTSIEYTDRYLVAPLPALLMARTLAAFRDQLAPRGASPAVTIITAPMRKDSFRGPPTQLNNNWLNEEDREQTIRTLLESFNLDARYMGRGAAHHRRLMLEYDDGSAAVIFFDQGFGYWRAAAGARHDFNRSPAAQAKALSECSAFISGQGESFVAVTRRR